MLEPAKISIVKVRNSVILWAAICCAFYIVFLLVMKGFGLVHLTGLRVVNYFVLFLVTFIGIKRWVTQTEHYVPFLTVFITALATGALSFGLFCVFLIYYSQFDPQLTELFHKHAPNTLSSVPAALILFEGAAVSIVIAFINMQYFRRYEEGEVSPTRKSQQP
jgi:hypothetical protein